MLQDGCHVTCLVRSTSNIHWLKGLPVTLSYGDVTDPVSLQRLIEEADVIIHAAAVLRARDTEGYYRVNQGGTKNIVEALKKAPNSSKKRLIYISSLAARGPQQEAGSQKEASPVSDYGKSKRAGEEELKALTGKVPFVIFRPAAVYGPRDKDILMFFALVNWNLVPRPIPEKHFQLVYVDDIIQAIDTYVNHIASTETTIYYLAEKTIYSWQQVGKTIAKSIGKTMVIPLPLPDMLLTIAGYIAELFAMICNKTAVLNRQKVIELQQPSWIDDPEPVMRDLGVNFTKLEIGATITYDWYRKHKWV